MARTSSRLVIFNTVLNLLNQVLAATIGFLLVDFFLSTLGEERYGIWILIGSIFGYRAIMAMGLNSAVNRYIPGHLVNDDMDGIRRVVSTAFAYFLLPAAILLVASLALFFHLEDWFTIPTHLVQSARAVALIVGVTFAISIPLQVYNAVLSSYQRYDIINGTAAAGLLLRTALVIYFLSTGSGLIALALIFGALELAVRFACVGYSMRLMSGAQLSPRFFDAALLREMFGYGISTALYMSGSILVFMNAELVIGVVLSPAAVSRFYVATTPIILLITLIQVSARAMKPAVSDLDARNDHDRIERMALTTQKLVLILLIPSIAFFVWLGGSFLQIWLGERFPEPGAIDELAAILAILTVGVGLRLSQYTNFITLVGKGDHRVFGTTTLAAVVGSLALCILGLAVFDMGAIGAAWACALPMGVVSTIVLPVHFSHKMDIPIRRMLRHSILPAALASGPAIAAILYWEHAYAPSSWLDLFVGIAIVGLLSLASSWAVGLTGAERRLFLNAVPIPRRKSP